MSRTRCEADELGQREEKINALGEHHDGRREIASTRKRHPRDGQPSIRRERISHEQRCGIPVEHEQRQRRRRHQPGKHIFTPVQQIHPHEAHTHRQHLDDFHAVDAR